MPRLPPVIKIRWPFSCSMRCKLEPTRTRGEPDDCAPRLLPPIAEPDAKDVRVTAVRRDHAVPDRARDPLLGNPASDRERHQWRHGRGNRLPGARVLVVNVDVGP